jgi:VWFA-related protein
LRQKSDQALVMDFGYSSNVTQAWTSDPSALAVGVRKARAGGQNPLGGTAIIDTIFRACLYEFGEVNHSASGNFILLFSDGEDNASRTSLAEAVNACQHSNTAVYAFHSEPKPGSSGPARLAALASQTGGRVFREDRSQSEIADDLKMIEADLRNEYRLIYKPADLKHDGSFHGINLITPSRVQNLTIRSGYYASNH